MDIYKLIDKELDQSPSDALASLIVLQNTAHDSMGEPVVQLYAIRSDGEEQSTYRLIREDGTPVADVELNEQLKRAHSLVKQFDETRPASKDEGQTKDPRPRAVLNKIDQIQSRERKGTFITQIVANLPKGHIIQQDDLNSRPNIVALDGYRVLDLAGGLRYDEYGETYAEPVTLEECVTGQEMARFETRRVNMGYLDIPTADFEYEDPERQALFEKLKTGELTPEERRRWSEFGENEDLTERSYKPTIIPAECPEVERLISVIMDGDEDMVDLLWEMAGRALSGEQYPQKTFVLWGTGGSGKGTFLSLLAGAFGDYVVQGLGYRDYFSNASANPAKVTALKGRLIQLDEIAEGAEIANDVLKRATERQFARELYSNTMVSSAQNTLVLTTNNPFSVERDSGVDRRLVVVPFGRAGSHANDMRNEVENAIRGVEEVYGKSWIHHPAVMSYVIEQTIAGYARMKTGHEFDITMSFMPDKVKNATALFFEEADPVVSSVAQIVEFTGDPEDRVTRKAIADMLALHFANEYDETLTSQDKTRAFRHIEDNGGIATNTIRVDGKSQGRGFTGVRLRRALRVVS